MIEQLITTYLIDVFLCFVCFFWLMENSEAFFNTLMLHFTDKIDRDEMVNDPDRGKVRMITIILMMSIWFPVTIYKLFQILKDDY